MFGFGSNKPNNNATQKVADPKKSLLLSAGGEIDGIVTSLVAAASDPDESVRQAIATSLYDIGFRQPGLVLSSCYEFLFKNPKADRVHRVILLKLIQQVLEEKRDEIPEDFGIKLVDLVVSEMTREKEVVPDWQQAASSVLVSLGMRFPNQIMDELVKRFEPGTLPHYFVMKTLGDFVTANALATVPRLREVLSRMLPVLASIKHDNTKWVFAASMGHFCDAIQHYVANIDQGTDKSLTVTSFSSEMFPTYELMFSKWIGSSEAKVRLATVQAIGSMFAVLSREQFETQVPRIIPAIVGMYKKEKDLLPITQALCSVLDVGVRGGGGFKGVLEPLLPPIFNTIHPLICQPPDYSNSSALKNYNELLRCFEIIGRGYSDVLVTYLLGRLEQKDPRTRAGALGVIRHLVTRLSKELEDKKGLLVSGVKPLVTNETVNSVKKALAQVVIAMASHEYLLLEGGESLVEFIIRGSAIEEEDTSKSPANKKKREVDPDGVTDAEIRNMSDNILNLITTTIPAMEPALWPFMFEALVPIDFAGATSIVCKCITYIATNKRANEDDDYIIDFDRAVNLPKPTAIIARLFVQLTSPFRRGQVGQRILECLKAIGPILHPSLPALWDVTLPKMINYLEENGGDKWNKDAWDELVLRLLSESIRIVNDDEWNVALGSALSDQTDFYKGRDPELKRSTYKQLGLVMQKSGHKEFIKSKLDTMFLSADHANLQESEGCATAYGYCAATHLDIVLEKLQVLVKQSFGKKSGGLFKFGGGGKSAGPSKKVKNTILLSLGYVATYAQPGIITSRVDVHIINPVKAFLPLLKSPGKKISSVKMIQMVGKAMHPSHLKSEYVLKQRDDLLRIILGYINPPNAAQSNTSVRVQVLSAAATLALLEPPLPTELETTLIVAALNLYNQPPETTDNALYDALNEMLAAVLFSQTNIACLCRLLKHLENWMRAKEVYQRERAVAATLNLIKKFIEYSSTEDKEDKLFTNMGSAVGLLVPRCTDPSETIRRSSMEGIQLLLYIDYMLKNANGSKQLIKPPEQLHPLTGLRDRIVTKEPNEQFGIVHEMSRVLAIPTLVSKEELPNLLHTSILGLTDTQATSTNGTCVVLNGLIKLRGEELQSYIASLIGGFLQAMEGITSDATMNGTLHALRNLALHHLLPVLDNLLTAPMPHTPQVIKAFQVLAKDRTLVMPLINHLTDIINNKVPYDEKANPKDKKLSVKIPEYVAMAATAALGEVMQPEELEEVVTSHYPQLFSSLLLRLGTANLNQPKTMEVPASNPKAKPAVVTPSQQAVAAFKSFFECGKDTTILAVMDASNNWVRAEQPDYYVTIAEVVAGVCKAHPDQMRGIFEFLLPYLRGNYTPQRIVTAAVFAELLNFCQSDAELLQKLVNSLLGAIVDPNVKLLSLKGLSNIVSNGQEQVNRYAPTIIDVLVSSIDDHDEVIAMESMLGLSKVFEAVDESRVAPILVNICHRIRPAFEKTNDAIRAAAFTLFGALWRFGQDSAADVFYEQIHSNLPTIVLHINDDSVKVQNACKTALRQLGPLMRAEEVNTLLTRKLEADRSLDYENFLDELSKLLINNYLERINYYVMTSVDFYKSQWNTIKANAAAFTGVLLGNLPAERRGNINLNPSLVTRALIGLLAEKANIVRKSAAEAMSLLYTY